MRPASWPREDRAAARLMSVEVATGRVEDHDAHELPGLLREGDLLVVNDAATLPASLMGRTEGGEPVEVRLVSAWGDDAWRVVLFGAGDWRSPTELRPPPPELRVGTRLLFGCLAAVIVDVRPESPRLLVVRFDLTGSAFWHALYTDGRPVQYSYLQGPLDLWHVQTAYASRPWAVEAPSGGYPVTGGTLAGLLQRGVAVTSITHAAGLSATGDTVLDALLPLDERFEIPTRAVEAISRARRRGGRVVAAGTTVVRALEGGALQHGGALMAGEGTTTLRLGPGYRMRIVDGLLTGMHDPTASHYALLQAFAPRALLDAAYAKAEEWGYLGHEFGDACLLL
jgi:S-adenosylmethionine:tRNA ribosyltransferase-isomerase